MTGGDQAKQFGRILLLLDVTSDAAPALESAAAMAARLDAPLVTLFVDDGRIERLEGHPSTRTIDLPTGLGGAVEHGALQRSWRAMARRMQQQLAELARRHRLEAHFDLLRDDVRRRLQELTDASDLMVVASSGRTVTGHVRVESRGHAMGCGLSGSVVFVGSQRRRINSVVAVYDGSPRASAGLDTALQMAAGPNVMLTLLLIGETVDDVDGLRGEVVDKIRRRQIRVRPHIRRITCCATDEIVRSASNVHANFVVVPSSDEYPQDAEIGELMRRLDCPLLVVRTGMSTEDEVSIEEAVEPRQV